MATENQVNFHPTKLKTEYINYSKFQWCTASNKWEKERKKENKEREEREREREREREGEGGGDCPSNLTWVLYGRTSELMAKLE